MVFLAVSLDDPKTESKHLQEVFERWKVHVPIVREPAVPESEPEPDPLCFKNRPLWLVPAPPIFVLGGNGVLQYFEVQYVDDRGGQASFVKDLPEQLDRLLAGKDVYPSGLRRYEEQQRRYQERWPRRPKANRPPSRA